MKQTNRRKFLGTIALTSAATGLGIPSLLAKSQSDPKDAKDAGAFEFLTEPYLQALTPTSVSIMCITSKNANTWLWRGDRNGCL